MERGLSPAWPNTQLPSMKAQCEDRPMHCLAQFEGQRRGKVGARPMRMLGVTQLLPDVLHTRCLVARHQQALAQRPSHPPPRCQASTRLLGEGDDLAKRVRYGVGR
ncbi:hypothetical protein Droror1_Dr00006182 [Drosera rotundifolia]